VPFRPYLPDQDFLLPPSLREWLLEEHLAYFVSDVVDQLDLAAIYAKYGEEERGQPPYHPRMMTKLLVYGYCVGVCSSRRIQRRVREDIGFRVLAAGNEPDFRTLSDFRKIHLEALTGLFEQVLRIALEAGAMKVGRVALDGTKVKANASKHKAMSYAYVQEKEKRLREQVKELLAQAEAADAEEDARHGKDQAGEELPEELKRRESRLARIRQAKKALEQRAREPAAAAGKSPEEVSQAKPGDKDQYNFTVPPFAEACVSPAAHATERTLVNGSGISSPCSMQSRASPYAITPGMGSISAHQRPSSSRPTTIGMDSSVIISIDPSSPL